MMIRHAVLMTIVLAQTTSATEPGKRAMSQHVATGTFDVSLTPVGTPDAAVGSMMIAKTFHGDLEGTSAGQMLAIRTPRPVRRATSRWSG